ncbi:TPA: fimbrial protein [Klebsiella pneumoniae]|nr:fimbrial protein [Klebsiella pneumoniae]HBR1441088.1 fimbrial protein [Klebsiella pneumoniae]
MNKYIANRFNKLLFVLLCIIFYTKETYAFKCVDAANNVLYSSTGGGVADLYVNLTPQIQPGQNLVVDIASSILCENTRPTTRDDYVTLMSGSTYDGALRNFKGSVHYYGQTYTFPLQKPTAERKFANAGQEPWQVKLYLTPISVASGVLIKRGDKIATLVLFQRGVNKGTANENEQTVTFTWNVMANHDVTILTGGCTIAADNVTVNLPDYPGTAKVPVKINCAKNQNLKFFLSGTTADAARTIFVNQANASPAQGVGVQLKRNNVIIPANFDISLGTVATANVDLGLVANYARTIGQVTAGNVQSIIYLTFEYE